MFGVSNRSSVCWAAREPTDATANRFTVCGLPRDRQGTGRDRKERDRQGTGKSWFVTVWQLDVIGRSTVSLAPL